MSTVGRGRAAGQFLFWDADYQTTRWLPAAAPATNQILSWNGTEPVWITSTGGFTAGGDLSGTSTSQNVIRLQGRAVGTAVPTDGSTLTWVAGSSSWVPVASGGAGGGIYEYATVAAAEAAAPGNNAIGFVAETDTFYRYMSADASNAVRDAKVILDTGAGGTTRWVAVAGRYGNIANSVLPIRNNPTYGSSTNTFLGKESLGQYYGALTTGSHNVTLGSSAGNRISSGSQNTYCGASSGSNLVGTFSSNTILGASLTTSCQFTASILVGRAIMSYSDTRAVNPIAIGDRAGNVYTATRPGTDIILIGSSPGRGRCATRTIAIGYDAASTGSYPGDNLCLGTGAGATLGMYTAGTRNVLLAASVVTSGSRNTLCGPSANSKVTTGSDNVVVHPRSYLGGGSVYADVNLTGVVAGGYRSADVGHYAVSFGYQVLSQSGVNPNIFPNNIGFGYEALEGGTGSSDQGVGPNNIGFGYRAGAGLRRYPADTGSEENIYFGCQSGEYVQKSSRNIYLGYRSGWGMDPSTLTTSFPYGADYSSNNIAVGRQAMEYSHDLAVIPDNDHSNVVFGHLAGVNIRDAFYSTFLGGASGTLTTNGDNNTCLGYSSNTTLGLAEVKWVFKDAYDRDHQIYSFSSVDNNKLCFLLHDGTWWALNIPEPPIPNYMNPAPWYEVTDPSEATLVGAGATSAASGVRLGAVGTTTVHGGVYTTDSDVRFKTAIEDCDLGLDFIRALTPRKFLLKASPQGPVHHGFIAQEVAQSLDGVESNIWSRPASKDGMQAVSYEAMIAPLTRAVQELAAKAVALRARIQILKNGGSRGPETLQADA